MKTEKKDNLRTHARIAPARQRALVKSVKREKKTKVLSSDFTGNKRKITQFTLFIAFYNAGKRFHRCDRVLYKFMIALSFVRRLNETAKKTKIGLCWSYFRFVLHAVRVWHKYYNIFHSFFLSLVVFRLPLFESLAFPNWTWSLSRVTQKCA